MGSFTEGSLDPLKGGGPAVLIPKPGGVILNVQFTEERERRHQALALPSLSPLQLVESHPTCDSPVFNAINVGFSGVHRSAPSLRIGFTGAHNQAPNGAEEEVHTSPPSTPMIPPGSAGSGVGLEGISCHSLVIPEVEVEGGESALGGFWEETAAAVAAGNGVDSVGRCRLTVPKTVLKAHTVSALEATNMMNRFQVVLSSSTCAATTRVIMRWRTSADSGHGTGEAGVGAPRAPRLIRRIQKMRKNARGSADSTPMPPPPRITRIKAGLHGLCPPRHSAQSFSTILTRILNLGFENSGPPRVVASVIPPATSFNPF